MNDPFAVDWSTAPDDATFHVVDYLGDGAWILDAEEIGIRVVDDPPYYFQEWVIDTAEKRSRHFDLTGLDWRNSLRARPN
jgi:hypothetical protein